MNILPSCSIKNLADCEPRQLVRVVEYGRDADALGLVADIEGNEGARAIIVLNEAIPAYSIINSPESYQVLAFVAQPSLVIDPFCGFETQPDRIFSAPGCISRHHNRWLMRVREKHSSFRPRQASFDLETGRLIDLVEELRSAVFFGKWCLTLPNSEPHEKAITVASFEWKAPQNS
ncbi:hypothetical protein JET14_09625 [Martelella lutilitoris]|uniref:Uncharacterized protein n=1 Tax=Martelella lutilitoris TaxID=2583532 RepID=A0A7T7HNA4_9HYPH|nr:hypothetical protein [Martelella lutilitoris]QQM32366.1 hypothetical protein JET14_09625 [Martelella lutilitoris]